MSTSKPSVENGNIADIQKQLESMKDQISDDRAKRVIFLVVVTCLTFLVLCNTILLLLDFRKKRKCQNDMPQAIVIQPNGASKDGKHAKSQKEKGLSYERDVLPSKSMKMKVAISPGMISSRKSKSKEEDGLVQQIPVSSSTDKLSKKEPASVQASTSSAPSSQTTPSSTSTAQVANQVMDITLTSTEASANNAQSSSVVTAVSAAPIPASGSNVAPSKTNSSASDAMTSFTVPEVATTTASLSINTNSAFPSLNSPKTPTATTLSGVDQKSVPVLSTPPLSNPKLLSESKSSDAKPVESPIVTAKQASATLVTPKQSDQNLKKVEALFPSGCGTGV